VEFILEMPQYTRDFTNLPIIDLPNGSLDIKVEPQGTSRKGFKIQFYDLKPDILLASDWTCIGSRRFGGRRCDIRIRTHVLERAAQEITKLQTSKEVPTEAELTDVAKFLLCEQYHQKAQATDIAKAWSGEVLDHGRRPVATPQHAPRVFEVMSKNAPEANIDKQPISRIDGFEKFTRRRRLTVSDLVKCMRATPWPHDSSGFIYVHTRSGTPSMVKIGVTVRDVQLRLLDIAKTCHYEPQVITQMPIINCRHTEKLIFISLDKMRRRELLQEGLCNNGNGCRHRHTEWFEVNKDVAVLTVQRWTEWMTLNPYRGDRLDVFWEANLLEAAERLPTLDAFHQWVEEMTQRCIQKGEKSWRGRSDGLFRDCNDEAHSVPISPVSSTFSNAPSLTSDTTFSSNLPDEQITNAVEEFVTLLLGDNVIRSLLTFALEKFDARKLERNFYKLLNEYSKALQAEAEEPFEIEAARFVRFRARNAANCVRSRIDPTTKDKSQALNALLAQEIQQYEMKHCLGINQSTEKAQSDPNYRSCDTPVKNGVNTDDRKSDDSESDGSELDEPGELNLPNLGRVKGFIATSEAFGQLPENLISQSVSHQLSKYFS
jgi:hypothetical protein